MNHFKIFSLFSVLAAVVFLVLGIVLIVTFVLNSSYLEWELAEASNFDNWGVYIIIAGIISLCYAVLNIYEIITLTALKSGAKNAIVAEMIYILGLKKEKVRPQVEGGDIVIPDVEVMSVRTKSDDSIFGLGYDAHNRWTFSGRKATPHTPKNMETC
ncbi:uncharacterized protein LOC111707994 [Eurytemora carolleeae]|uniref:uncharacterized protein LOC111707994 n=1 Tax=Eurytemora carolleeae TaxID=1294199 RepID=UPI000C75F8FB|nr:uncharacterized protein LOC111707994 [Eurytemora carolleeae]|eukprot:XP_023336980.1 uncharacterized protein LOC111707994 [Eurytemora affinis]